MAVITPSKTTSLTGVDTLNQGFISNEIEDTYLSHLDLNGFCTVDNNLQGVAGDRRTIYKYTPTGTAVDVAEGVGNTASIAVGLTGYKKTSTIASDQNLGGCSDYFILVLGIPSITIETGDWYDWPWDYASEWDDVRDRNSGVVPALASFFHTL